MRGIFGWITRNRAWQQLVTLVILGLAVLSILPQITALANSWQVLTSMRFWAVGLAFVAQAASYLGSGYLLKSILAIAHQEVSLWLDTLIVLGSTSVGMVAGGTVGSSAAIFRWTSGGKDDSVEGATLAGLFLPQFNSIMLVLVSIFGLAHLIVVRSVTQAELIGFGATLLILGTIIGSIALAARFRDRANRAVVWMSGRVARLRRKPADPHATREGVRDLFGAWDALWRGAWLRPVAGAFLNMAFDILTLYLLFVAAGESISLGTLVAGYGLPLLLGKVAFIIPGGVGVVEGSMVVLYNGLGVPRATTAVVVLGYRLISFWIPSLVGFPVAAYLQGIQKRDHPSERTRDIAP